jgi:hypothetical protein
MKILKLENCPPTLSEFAKKINIEYTKNSNQCNEILCQNSEKLDSNLLLHPKMFFIYSNSIFSFEFIPGKAQVVLGKLNFSVIPGANTKEIDKYMNFLISDPHRVWSYTTLTYDKSPDVSNQVLTLLRLCKINVEDYLKNPNVLSKKFGK